MSSRVILTWAIPVEAHLLGASLEAYVGSKATISTLRLCAQNGNPSEAPIARLPPEMVEEIVGHAQLPFYEKQFREWVDVTNCLEDWGHMLDHDQDRDEDHRGKFERQLRKLCFQTQQSTEGKRFAECRKIFAQDFGLEIHFDILSAWAKTPESDRDRTVVLGYVTLPLVLSKIKRSKGPGVVSYLASKIIDPSVLTPVTADERRFFEKAMQALQLEPISQDGGMSEARLLHPPSIATEEQDSHVCGNPGCLARFDAAKELRFHRFSTPSHPEFLGIKKCLKVSKELEEPPVGQPNNDEWPKLMILSCGLLAAGACYNSDDDDE